MLAYNVGTQWNIHRAMALRDKERQMNEQDTQPVRMRVRDSELASMIAPARRDNVPATISQKELNKVAAVVRLHNCGHTVEEIANLCGCSPLRVQIILTSLKENAAELAEPPKGRKPKTPKVARRMVAADAE